MKSVLLAGVCVRVRERMPICKLKEITSITPSNEISPAVGSIRADVQSWSFAVLVVWLLTYAQIWLPGARLSL